ncbi:dentin sialophosphoprotein-like [Drosophila serrata]|uniref:dentin sialophosphoprotein-like n=1 Tax=Drosophila serrata TaxID=7274 RepID=UPI000A1D3954|nr:dentin sialophosphoprotein-like [Drosophila serrata]
MGQVLEKINVFNRAPARGNNTARNPDRVTSGSAGNRQSNNLRFPMVRRHSEENVANKRRAREGDNNEATIMLRELECEFEANAADAEALALEFSEFPSPIGNEEVELILEYCESSESEDDDGELNGYPSSKNDTDEEDSTESEEEADDESDSSESSDSSIRSELNALLNSDSELDEDYDDEEFSSGYITPSDASISSEGDNEEVDVSDDSDNDYEEVTDDDV